MPRWLDLAPERRFATSALWASIPGVHAL